MKKSIVLFTTLMMIMALMAVMTLFLNSTKKSKDNFYEEFALIQTNAIVNNLLSYLKSIKFTKETIFYGSKVAFPIELDNSMMVFSIASAHKHLNINTLVGTLKTKDSISYEKFVSFLYKYRVKNPEFFIDILLDTKDDDILEQNSGSGSEIVLENPIFRNGKIYNKKHFKIIVDYYAASMHDSEIYKVPFDKIFGFVSNSGKLDINFATQELLELIFEDVVKANLTQISQHNKLYETLKELPFDEMYIQKNIQGKLFFGHHIDTNSILINVNVDFDYKKQFISKVNFIYNTNAKSLTNYQILDIKPY